MSFSDYIQKSATSLDELPLVHTTEYFNLPLIRSSHTLEPRDSKIFGEPLLYFFYGRPAYRDPDATVPTRDISFYPICFVFKPGTICKQAKRLYPFDTGASQDGLYEPAINRTDALTAYQVQAVVDNAKRITTCFFETHEGYLSGKPRPGLVFTTAENDAALYYRLINGGGAALEHQKSCFGCPFPNTSSCLDTKSLWCHLPRKCRAPQESTAQQARAQPTARSSQDTQASKLRPRRDTAQAIVLSIGHAFPWEYPGSSDDQQSNARPLLTRPFARSLRGQW
jgi:hypothetical protein